LPDRRRFEAHISECDGCDEFLRQLRKTITLAGKLDAESIPAEMQAELRRAFRHWKAP
jgi:anti-sigma factor RsiW